MAVESDADTQDCINGSHTNYSAVTSYHANDDLCTLAYLCSGPFACSCFSCHPRSASMVKVVLGCLFDLYMICMCLA